MAVGLPGGSTRIHALPLELVGTHAVPYGRVLLHVGAGLTLGPSFARTQVGTATSSRTRLELGGAVVGGVTQPAGPGFVVGELTLVLARAPDAVVDSSPRGAQLSVGYRLGL